MAEADRGYRKTLIGILATGLLLTSLMAWVVYDSYLATWDHAVETSSNLTTALQRDISRTLESLDLSLKAALSNRQSPEMPLLSPLTRQRLLFDGSIEAKHVGSLFLMDAAGHITDSSSQLGPRDGTFADRDYFTVHRDRSDVGLYISKPFQSRIAHEWQIALSRRINGPDGGFAGVAVGTIRFAYFGSIFSNLHLGDGAAIALLSLDGTLLYETPLLASRIGKDLRAARVFQEIGAGRTAPYYGASRGDGIVKLFAFTLIDSFPLVLSLNIPIETIYADWKAKALVAGFAALVLLLAGATLVHAARRQLTRRIQSERQLAHTARLLQTYFDHSPDALFVVNVAPDGRLTYESYNRACQILIGVMDQRAIGREPCDIFSPDIAASVEERYRACIRSGQTYAYEETRVLAAGRRDLHAVLCPIRDEQGTIISVLGSARDMTEQHRQAAEQHQANKLESVGRLTAGVAHDFNNYMQTIIGSLDIIEADYLKEPEAVAYGQLARKAATNGARLTHRLLAFSRQQVLRPQRVNAATLLSETRMLVGSAAFGAAIEFKMAVEAFTDDIRVDPAQAENCLLNLLFNSRDAMPEGGRLVLHARNARPTDGFCGDLAPEGIVILAVHDSGAGMDAATRAKAFEPFFTTKGFGKGSGLGLSMVQGFCRQSGGEVRIMSGEGVVGTRVELWLPATPAAPGVTKEVSENITCLGRPTGRVLLIGDEPAGAAPLAPALVNGGFEVVAVISAKEGLARFDDRHPYDAVLTNALPDVSAVEFVTEALGRQPQLPILIMNEAGTDPFMSRLRSPILVLRDPASPEEVLATLRRVLAKNRVLHSTELVARIA